jgi:ribosomal protein S13
MARISGVTIPSEKQVWVALTYVYGIGPKTADVILEIAKVERTIRVKNLSDAEIARIQDVINADYVVEGELQRVVAGNTSASRTLTPTAACATSRTCRPAASAPAPTLAPSAASVSQSAALNLNQRLRLKG